MTGNVTKNTQFNKIVTELIKIRKEAGFTQEFIADWLDISRKKLNEFENGKFNFDLMVNYCDKLSVDLKINYQIN